MMKTNIFALFLLCSISLQSAILLGPATNSANGHIYFLLSSNTWSASQAEAVSLGGNLVTINDAAENDWVFTTFSGGQRNLWLGLSDGDTNGTYTWVDGSSLSYSNWDFGQPNLGSERWAFIVRDGLGTGFNAGKWHDAPNEPSIQFPWLGPVFGVVELSCSPHRAKAIPVIVNGFLVGATITDAGCGYTNVPLVLIRGGSGSGAEATAVISDGRVTDITITSAGSGYSTNDPPSILIASPPFVPTVTISVSSVRVTQHVVLGRTYVLETSPDMVDWSATGPAFVAESEEITSEFILSDRIRYFRVRQVQ